MATTSPTLSVAIYFYGDGLLPPEITAALGTEPSKAWPKGSVISQKNASSDAIAKTGLWMLRTSSPSSGVEEHIEELLRLFRKSKLEAIGDLPGVETAKIDIYIIGVASRDFDGQVTPQQLVEIGNLGIRLDLSVGCLHDDE